MDLSLFQTLFSGGFLGLQQLLSVGGQFHLGDDNVAWVDSDVDGLAVSFFSGDSLDVDNVLLPVNSDDFTGLFAFEVSSNDFDFVVRTANFEVEGKNTVWLS